MNQRPLADYSEMYFEVQRNFDTVAAFDVAVAAVDAVVHFVRLTWGRYIGKLDLEFLWDASFAVAVVAAAADGSCSLAASGKWEKV